MRFSAVIPAHNAAATIARAVRSVHQQTCLVSEIIVVDDGSTDDTARVLGSFRNMGVTVVRTENRGVAAARNTGANLATGDVVAYLDADDEWAPGFVRAMKSLLAAEPAAWVAASGYSVVLEAQRTTSSYDVIARPDFLDKQLLASYFAASVAMRASVICSSAVCIRREMATTLLRFPEGETHGEDVLVWTRAALSAPIGYSPRPLSVYYRSVGAGTWVKSPKSRFHPLQTQLSEAETAALLDVPGGRRFLRWQAANFLKRRAAAGGLSWSLCRDAVIFPPGGAYADRLAAVAHAGAWHFRRMK